MKKTTTRSYHHSPKGRCLICNAYRPISHVAVWKDGKLTGCICASHTFYEAIIETGLDVGVALVPKELRKLRTRRK